jgi:hypothetical protein
MAAGSVLAFPVQGVLEFKEAVGQEAGGDEEDQCHCGSFVEVVFLYAGCVPISYSDTQVACI